MTREDPLLLFFATVLYCVALLALRLAPLAPHHPFDYSGNLNEQIHYAPQESERSVFTQGIYGTFFDLGFKVQILDYYMNN